jgi:hypothetical protein
VFTVDGIFVAGTKFRQNEDGNRHSSNAIRFPPTQNIRSFRLQFSVGGNFHEHRRRLFVSRISNVLCFRFQKLGFVGEPETLIVRAQLRAGMATSTSGHDCSER